MFTIVFHCFPVWVANQLTFGFQAAATLFFTLFRVININFLQIVSINYQENRLGELKH